MTNEQTPIANGVKDAVPLHSRCEEGAGTTATNKTKKNRNKIAFSSLLTFNLNGNCELKLLANDLLFANNQI